MIFRMPPLNELRAGKNVPRARSAFRAVIEVGVAEFVLVPDHVFQERHELTV
jgi:hypothetical protein